MNNVLIDRNLLQTLGKVFRYFPVLTLTGPRQSGKTTLCRKLFAELPYYNLEDAATLASVQHDPKAFVLKHSEGMVIDEAQRFPEIFSYLQEKNKFVNIETIIKDCKLKKSTKGMIIISIFMEVLYGTQSKLQTRGHPFPGPGDHREQPGG